MIKVLGFRVKHELADTEFRVLALRIGFSTLQIQVQVAHDSTDMKFK